MVKIYHNPKCSKSRETLAIIESTGQTPEIIEYLKTGFTKQDIENILDKLDISAQDLARSKESKDLGIDLEIISSEELIDEMLKNPILVERPIVITEKGCRIGRPPEKIRNIL